MIEEEAFYLTPQFWTAASFGFFMLLISRPIGRMIAKKLDARSLMIADELQQARTLRAEAEALLVTFQEKHQASLKEAEAILEKTREDAKNMGQRAELELKSLIEKRTKLSLDKIAQSESKALNDVQNHVVDIAIAAARTIIEEYLLRSGNDELVKQAAGELERKLH